VRVHPVRGEDGSVIGAIEIFSEDTAHSDARRKAEAMNRLAFLDHLTQLPNRRFVEMAVQTAWTEFQMHKEPFGIIMVDVDGFKTINDSFGHGAGDRALQQVAQTLSHSLRPTDTVGRWGGDEFMAIVRNIRIDVLKRLADRCVTLAKQILIPGSDDRLIRLSISVGATVPRTGETCELFLQRADALMYRSKSNGRGCATTE
jgi:diguanylate cyclase (GGDEF)-like protein